MKRFLPVLLVLASGCTVIDTVSLPSDRSGREIFVTAGDIAEPYESLGVVQVMRSGVLLFGFVDPVGTDLESGFRETLLPQIAAMGGDGAINARFAMTQYLPLTRVLGAIFFIFPLPTQVTITAEVVKLRAPEAAPTEPRVTNPL